MIPDDLLCNDVHSRLNPTRVARVFHPETGEDVSRALVEAAAAGLAVSICGARHAMGGQQFGEGTLLLDLSGLKGMGQIDRLRGLVEAGAGLKWPELIDGLHSRQDDPFPWTIRQKQTGADDLTLGGALAANIHGRGVKMRPIIGDVEAFTLVRADGAVLRCSRHEHAEWFRLAIGGYGCFGVIISVCLRLVRRRKLRRLVEVTTAVDLMARFEERMDGGCLYGDFQFSIDERSPDFLFRGVLSSYRPVADDLALPTAPRELDRDDWAALIRLAHHDRAEGFRRYTEHYLGTHGGLYWSDSHQLGVYLEGYHLDPELCPKAGVPASEMITELYVLRDRLADFLAAAASDLRERRVTVIYGTVRLIQRDEESFLAWAKEDYACVIFNLHTDHDEEGIGASKDAFRALIDLALERGGCFFLTYHRWARKDQLERAYPEFQAFLAAKAKLDPDSRFQSEWWRHGHRLFTAGES